MVLPSSQERTSLSTQSSRKSSLHTLMPLVSTKSKAFQNGLDISKDKPREMKRRESLKKRRERKEKPEKLEKLRKLSRRSKPLRSSPSRSTSSLCIKRISPSILANLNTPRKL